MAVVNVKSVLVSNFDAQPRILSNSFLAGALPIETVTTVAIGATDSIGSTYRVGFIPSGARVSDIWLQNDALTNGTSYECGVAFNTADGGALPVALSDEIFFAAVDMHLARNAWTSVYNPSILAAGGLPANATLRVWE